MAAVQIYTENHARGTEENLHSSRVFSRSLAVDSTPSLFKVIIYKCPYCIHHGKYSLLFLTSSSLSILPRGTRRSGQNVTFDQVILLPFCFGGEGKGLSPKKKTPDRKLDKTMNFSVFTCAFGESNDFFYHAEVGRKLDTPLFSQNNHCYHFHDH